MKQVFKYELRPNTPHLRLPKGAVVLSTGCQREGIFIWAEVDANRPTETRFFEVFGTGHEIRETAGMHRKFVGTALMNEGQYVWHVFEKVHEREARNGDK